MICIFDEFSMQLLKILTTEDYTGTLKKAGYKAIHIITTIFQKSGEE